MLKNWIAFRFKSDGLLGVWNSFFFTTVWFLWEERNHRIFQRKASRREQLLRRITSHVRELADAKAWVFHISKKAIIENLQITWHQQQPKSLILIAWYFPCPHHFKLNIDGASLQNPGSAGGGRLIRGDDGTFIAAFATAFCIVSNNYVEYYTLIEGINLAIQWDCFPLQIKSDSSLLVNVIQSQCNAAWGGTPYGSSQLQT
ncbi:hypothetical protein AMTRI_Chr06g177930 [Amborella trichopoda]